MAAAIARRLPDVDVVCSSDVLPEIREYERTATTCCEAYARPGVGAYLRRLADRLKALGLPVARRGRVRRRHGGRGGRGAVGGVAGTLRPGRWRGWRRPRGAHGRFRPRPQHRHRRDERRRGTHPRRRAAGGSGRAWWRACRSHLPRVLVETVSAGGGSIGWVDEGGALRAGPRSAGAVPGPVAFGRGGTQPTVTDAHVALGNIAASHMSDAVRVDADPARRAVTDLAATRGEHDGAHGRGDHRGGRRGDGARAAAGERGAGHRSALLRARRVRWRRTAARWWHSPTGSG